MLRVPAFLLGPLSGVQLAVAAVILGAASLFAIFIAAGFGWQSDSPVKLDERWAKKAAGPIDDDEERASISLGWLVHGFLSIKARIGRLDCAVTNRRSDTPRPGRWPFRRAIGLHRRSTSGCRERGTKSKPTKTRKSKRQPRRARL